MFNPDTAAGNAARSQFLSGLSGMFGAGSRIRITGIRPITIGRRRVQDAGSVTIEFVVEDDNGAYEALSSEGAAAQLATALGESEEDVEVNAGAQTLDASEFQGRVFAYGPGLAEAVVGQPTLVTVQAFDEYHNDISDEITAVSLEFHDGAARTTSVTDGEAVDAASVAYGVLECDKAVRFVVVTQIQNTTVRDGPYVVGCQAAAVSPEHVQIVERSQSSSGGAVPNVDDAEAMQAGQTEELIVNTADQFGNRVATGGQAAAFTVDFNLQTAHGSAPCTTCTHQIVDFNDGSYAIEYQAESTGTYSIDVRFDGAPVLNSPVVIEITPGDLQPQSIELSVEAGLVGGTASIRASLFDHWGNTIWALPAGAALLAYPVRMALASVCELYSLLLLCLLYGGL
jgi:hypothetical protein